MHLFYLRVRVFLRRPSRLVHVRFSTRLQFHLRRQLVREIFGVHRPVLKFFRVNYSSAGMCTAFFRQSRNFALQIRSFASNHLLETFLVSELFLRVFDAELRRVPSSETPAMR